MKKIVVVISVIVYGILNAQTSEITIIQIMEKQATAWNEGNIDGFMKYYWNDPQLTFVSKRGVSKGWQKVYDNYKISYPDKSAMGILTFGDLVIEAIGNKTIMVTGSWHLQKDEEAGGWFTLIFKKIKKDWFIVYDHTS